MHYLEIWNTFLIKKCDRPVLVLKNLGGILKYGAKKSKLILWPISALNEWRLPTLTIVLKLPIMFDKYILVSYIRSNENNYSDMMNN